MTGVPTTDPQAMCTDSRVRLVDIGFVRAAYGCDAETILKGVCDWTHSRFTRWVFDLAVKPGRTRHLRWWRNEIASKVEKFAEPSVIINEILGSRPSFAPLQLEVEWCLSAQTMMRLREAGEIVQENGRFTRASLAAFLKRRLL